MKRIVVPKLSGVLSAIGGLAADMTMDFHSSHFTDSRRFDYKGVNRKLKALEEQAQAFLSRTGVAIENTKIEFVTEARYANQVWELDIPLRGNQIEDKEVLAQLVEDFHSTHERILGVRVDEELIEFINWGVQAIAKVPTVGVNKQPYGGRDPSYALVARRKAYFRELGGLVETPVYRGDKFLGGARVDSPAIIQEPTSTLVVFPGSVATVSQWGNYLIESE
jgi:N-methylhydantoinase A